MVLDFVLTDGEFNIFSDIKWNIVDFLIALLSKFACVILL